MRVLLLAAALLLGRPACAAPAAAEFADADRALDAGRAADAARIADEVLRARGSAAGSERVALLAAHGRFMVAAARYRDAQSDVDALISAGAPAFDRSVAAAELLLSLGRADEAMRQARAAEQARPDAAAALFVVGRILWAQGKRDEAIERVRRAVGADPSSPAQWLELASMLRAVGRFDEAKVLYERARQADPRGFQAYLEQGYMRLLRGESADAVSYFEAFVRDRPDDPLPIHHLAASLWFAGRRQEACARFDDALAAWRKRGVTAGDGWVHTQGWRMIACLEGPQHSAEFDAAVADLEAKAPRCSFFWLRTYRKRVERVWAGSERLGDTEKAVRRALEACRTAPESARMVLQEALAEVLVKESRREEALSTARDALASALRALEPIGTCGSILDVSNDLGFLFEAQGAAKEAYEAYELALRQIHCKPPTQQIAWLHARLMRHDLDRTRCASARAHRDAALRIARSAADQDAILGFHEDLARLEIACPTARADAP